MRLTKGQEIRQQRARVFLHQAAALVTARCLLLAPLERMKVVLQVDRLANYTNPADRPKGVLDLTHSKCLSSPHTDRGKPKLGALCLLQGH